MINPKTELFKWGPIPGRVCYPTYWMECVPLMKERLGLTYPEMMYYFHHDEMICVLERDALYDKGVEFFKKFMGEKRDPSYQKWKEVVTKITTLQEGICFDDLSEDDLATIYEQWRALYLEFWITGMVCELCNWGGERLLTEYLQKNHPEEWMKLLERLSAPTKLSFYQQEEIDLCEASLSDDVDAALKEHSKKHFWIQNSYFETKVVDGFTPFTKEEARKKMKGITAAIETTKKQKQEIFKNQNLSSEIIQLVEDLSFSIWWQDERKKYIFILSHYATLFMNEIARRKGTDELYHYTSAELISLLKEDKQVEKPDHFLFHYIPPKELTTYTGTRAKEIITPYLEIDKSVSEIKGLPVSMGNASGKVRILKNPNEHIEKGEILVTSMTSPEFIVAMRKAAAIVTDHGGITSHAAIVSRELGIPCIVGTKVATTVLHNGEEVEIDTEEGVIKRKE